jgi:hypothetical protein
MSTTWVSRTSSTGLISFVLGLLACAGPIKTSHDFDSEVDFTRFRTFAWISSDSIIGPSAGTSVRYVSPIDEQRIRRAVDSEMAKKGYRQVELAASDLVVSFAIGSEEKVRVQETPGRGTVYTRPYGYGSLYRGSTVRVTTYTGGTLGLEFFDRVSKQAVWVGWGSKRLSERDDSGEVISEAVAKILLPFPSQLESEPSTSP